MKAPSCPDCSKTMEEGFVPDSTYGAMLHAQWHPGPPEQATFFGLPAGTKVRDRRLHPVAAYRCPSCGLLRLYARRPS